MPNVILCEKPAQARDMAQALGGATGKGHGWIDCPAARITWTVGHMFDTAAPEQYDERYKRWRLEDLPIIPPEWVLEPRDGLKDHLKAVIATLRQATTLYIATDSGREGELIAYEIIERAGVKVPIKRLWFSAQNEEALRRAWANPKEGHETVRLFHAAQTRQRADWLFGMNLTRAATMVFGNSSGGKGVLSYGRVQTPTLALIVARDKEIESFKSRPYFEISARVRCGNHGLTMKYAPSDEGKRIWKKEDAEAMLTRVKTGEGPIRVNREAKRQSPPKPYSLTELTGDANTRFGYSAQTTLDLAQALYEKHKSITYPRSDCEYLPEEMAKEVATMLHFLIQTQVVPNHPELAKPLLRKTNFDNTKLTDHHAIVPTPIRAPVEQMNADERNVFGLIALRFAQMVMPDYEYEATVMTLLANEVPLEARGRVPQKMGWKDLDRAPKDEADKDDDGDLKELPPLRDGAHAMVVTAEALRKATVAPQRYTEKSLTADMKNVQRLVDDPVLKKRLKETSGLGTVATRPNIIETLKKREFVSLGGPGKRFITSSPKGRLLITSLPVVLTLPGLTAAWEDLLEGVAEGKRTREEALGALQAHMQKQLAIVLETSPPPSNGAPPASSGAQVVGEKPRGAPASRPNNHGWAPGQTSKAASPPLGEQTPPSCPTCSREMRWRLNRKTQVGFFGCTGYPECTTTFDPKNPEKSARKASYGPPPECPNCQKRMRIIEGSRGPFFGCTGYPECMTSIDVTTGDQKSHAPGTAGRSISTAPKPSFR